MLPAGDLRGLSAALPIGLFGGSMKYSESNSQAI